MYRTQGVLALLALYLGLVQSLTWDIVVARSNRLEFYNEGILVHTATPATHRIKWLTYDPINYRVLFGERYNREESVSSFEVEYNNTQSFLKKKTSRYLTRFAYDPATEFVFETVEKSIYSFSLRPGYNSEVNGYLVITLETIPQQVAVDSCGGYLYWITNNIIERALFNGSEREIIIDNMSNATLRQGLTVDSQKIYWIETQEYNDGTFSIESADLDGNNKRTLFSEIDSDWSPDKLTVSKNFIAWGNSFENFFWQLEKNPSNDTDVKPNKIAMDTTISSCGSHDIAANYNIEERTEHAPNCDGLLSILPDYYVCMKSSVFCVHGTKIKGESRCDCIQGYIGGRCDISICENYCFQGNCSISADGQPKCRCDAGYTGERCDTAVCENYCLQGDCNVSAEGQPKCRCNAGYSGMRCDINACHERCLNNGNCSLNEEYKPVCQCTGQYEGERCEVKAEISERFHWLPLLLDGKLPPGAIIGGFQRQDTYIARTYLNGSLCPGKYIQDIDTAYFSSLGKEFIGKHFEILCGLNAKWVKTDYDNIPENAFIGGSTREVDGEPLYICRKKIKNNLVSGKALARTKTCYLSYYDEEIETSSYEILVEE